MSIGVNKGMDFLFKKCRETARQKLKPHLWLTPNWQRLPKFPVPIGTFFCQWGRGILAQRRQRSYLCLFWLCYITYFLINITPVAIIINIDIVKTIYCPVTPVCNDKITGASSWSSSPSTLLFGVESISGVLLSL